MSDKITAAGTYDGFVTSHTITPEGVFEAATSIGMRAFIRLFKKDGEPIANNIGNLEQCYAWDSQKEDSLRVLNSMDLSKTQVRFVVKPNDANDPEKVKKYPLVIAFINPVSKGIKKSDASALETLQARLLGKKVAGKEVVEI